MLFLIKAFNLAVLEKMPQPMGDMMRKDRVYMATEQAPHGFKKAKYTTSFIINQELIIMAAISIIVTYVVTKTLVTMFKRKLGDRMWEPDFKPNII